MPDWECRQTHGTGLWAWLRLTTELVSYLLCHNLPRFATFALQLQPHLSHPHGGVTNAGRQLIGRQLTASSAARCAACTKPSRISCCCFWQIHHSEIDERCTELRRWSLRAPPFRSWSSVLVFGSLLFSFCHFSSRVSSCRKAGVNSQRAL